MMENTYTGLEKKLNTDGRKSWQREDSVDRSLPYKKYLIANNKDGFFLDVDCIKWKTVNGVLKPFVITELTACNGEAVVSQAYLDSIISRVFSRDIQGAAITRVS